MKDPNFACLTCGGIQHHAMHCYLYETDPGTSFTVGTVGEPPSAVLPATGNWQWPKLPELKVTLDPKRIKVDPDSGDVSIAAPNRWSETDPVTIGAPISWPGYSFNLPKRSDWVCYLFGTKPDRSPHTVWYPDDEHVPNAFVRWMMKVCFACTWVKEKP